ncbi:hypothetical protein HH214_04390 [Mucilaginibacter robiniae]|uniref:Uncharacterized protein n=1 Tax=Mucilaginibacter robiniae TaxID=2728022 RepID=A0A7L5DVR3_9SPHI|nr:hypothetical protein [Mucilaginibacter robiniae]QJD95172.1 hypothetical protein HH214_04390 [Mucilaginibacter robiniae]
MNKADQAFNEEFKPVFPPEAYHAEASWQDKVLFALSQLGAGNAPEVATKLAEFETQENATALNQHAEEVLQGLYKKGLIKGHEQSDGLQYDLSKITRPNTGGTDPDLL